MSEESDAADEVREANEQAVAHHEALSPATIKFQQTGDTEYSVSFGETENTGQLMDNGQGVDNNRIGVLTIRIALYRPELLQTFTVLAAPRQPQIVGKRYKVSRPVSNPSSPVFKAYCRRIEE